jgi:hypothetical protein
MAAVFISLLFFSFLHLMKHLFHIDSQLVIEITNWKWIKFSKIVTYKIMALTIHFSSYQLFYFSFLGLLSVRSYQSKYQMNFLFLFATDCLKTSPWVAFEPIVEGLIPSRIFFPIAPDDDCVFSDSEASQVFPSESQQQNGGRGYTFSDHLEWFVIILLLKCIFNERT